MWITEIEQVTLLDSEPCHIVRSCGTEHADYTQLTTPSITAGVGCRRETRKNRSLLSSRHPFPEPQLRPRFLGPSGRRPSGMRRSPGRPPAARRARWSTWPEGHTRGMAPVVARPTVRLGHPVDVYFGPLKPIFFISWLRNGPIGPKGSYPNQTKQILFCPPDILSPTPGANGETPS